MRADQHRVSVRAVVVDDDDEMRLLVAAMLRIRMAADVVGTGANGEEAVELAASLRPDVLVLDHVMPVRSGGDSVAEVRRVSPETCIVMFSATVLYALNLAGGDPDGDGVPDGFVSKSDGLVGLHLAIQRCLERRGEAAAPKDLPAG
jgi:DNA-binding NarL/FixJ family response regulator